MSQHSGFFESRWDETLVNPETGTLGDWDLKYYYNQFSEYFSKFFGNGVYYNPDNCLKVIANGGMGLLVKAGWAFIKGFWYELDEDTTLTVPANSTAYERTDSVMLRWSLSNRTISLVYLTDIVTPTRNDVIFDLKIAEVIVGAGVAEILGSVITDTRTNEEVCGIVRGLEADAIDTESLFAQYNAIFNEWFDTVKGQVYGDLGARLQLEFTQLNQNVEDYYANTQQQIEGYQEGLDQTVAEYENRLEQRVVGYENEIRQFKSDTTQDIADYKAEVQQDISDYEAQIENQISGYNTNYQATLNAERQIVADFVDKDYVISDAQTGGAVAYTFVNKVCEILDAKITANTLVDVYFDENSITEAIRCIITPTTQTGKIVLTARRQPTTTLSAIIRVRVR